MSSRKCFAILKRWSTFPTRSPIGASPFNGRTGLSVAVTILLSSRSVASKSAWRFLVRRTAIKGFLHTMRRSPGYSGLWISARSRSSKNESWIFPVSTSGRMAGARSAVIQSKPSIGLISSRIRASVIMPRSPTSTTRESLKRWRSFSIWAPSVLGSAVFPSNTSIATGHPARLHKRPKTICNLSFFPSRE
jgi:hypothetical protein